MSKLRVLACVCTLAVAGCSRNDTQTATGQTAVPSQSATSSTPGTTLAQWAGGAQLFDNLGTYSRKAMTRPPSAGSSPKRGKRRMLV